jgi:condensin complex subunit 1
MVTTSVQSRLPAINQRKRRNGHGKVVVYWVGRVSDDLYCRRRREDAEDAMDVDEEDEVDSIMDEDEDEDEPEPSEAGEGGHTEEVDGDEEEGTTPKSKAKKGGRKSELDNMAALTDEQAALAALESNQLLHLRLRKRYYSEALNFIRQVEEASQIILQLLGSTHKSEVLESMEFFRVAREYQLDSAEVSLETL